MPRWAGAVLALFVVAGPVLAGHDQTDRVTTDDGAVYIGEIDSVQYATVTLDTDPAGTIGIEWRYVTGLTSKFQYRIELTGGVIGNRDLQALPLIEIIPDDEHEFFDYEAKYTAGITQEICPARIDDEMTQKAQTYAKKAHRALFCSGYSRTDMILKDGEIYVLETNTIPGMTATSLLPQAAQVAGLSFSQLLDQLIELSIEAHRDSAQRVAQ